MQVADTNLGNFTLWLICHCWLNLPEAKKDFTDVKFLIIHQSKHRMISCSRFHSVLSDVFPRTLC